MQKLSEMIRGLASVLLVAAISLTWKGFLFNVTHILIKTREQLTSVPSTFFRIWLPVPTVTLASLFQDVKNFYIMLHITANIICCILSTF